MTKKILVLGGANLDLVGTGALVQGSSVNGEISTSVGGVARNIAEVMASLGMQVQLITILGDDLPGQLILKHCEQVGIDMSLTRIHTGAVSGMYVALHDADGDLNLAVADTALVQDMELSWIIKQQPLFSGADLVVADTNLEAETLKAIAHMTRDCGVPLAVDPVSVQKVNKVRSILSYIDIFTPNEHELMELNASGYNLPESMILVVKKGARGLRVKTPDSDESFPALTGPIINTSGAGDVLVGTFLAAFMQGFTFSECGRLGLAAAALTVASKQTVPDNICWQNLKHELEAD